MKAKWLAGALVASTLAVPAFAQFSVYLGTPPPPIRYERRPVMPGDGYTWVQGYWGVQGNRYVWVPGRWERPPYAGAYWQHPHYDHYERGYQYHGGHWDREDHDDHHDWDHERDERPR